MGVEKLRPEQRPPQEILLQWIGEILQNYEYRYDIYKHTIAEMAGFYNGHGYKITLEILIHTEDVEILAPRFGRILMLGANYGGRAINITATTAAHAMSYKITSLYKLPHGHAVAVCLPEIWEYMIGNMDKCIEKRGQEYLINIFNKITKAMGCEVPEQAISEFRGMMEKMELANPISDKKDEDLKVLSTSVNPVRLKNSPIEIDTITAEKLYSMIVS